MQPLQQNTERVADFSMQKASQTQDPLSKVREEVGQRADALAERFFKKKRMREEEKSNVPTLEKKQVAPAQLNEKNLFTVDREVFEYNDFPYIVTSEKGQAEALEKVRGYPEKKNGIFLGFAFEFNYHLLAERSVQHAFICDINLRMHMLYKFIENNIVGCESREAFLQKLKAEFEKKKNKYFGFSDGVEKIIDYFKETQYSWLSSDEKFLKIRQLYRDKKIQHLNLNLEKDFQAFERLKNWATQNGYEFDVVYVSNIPEWVIRTGSISALKGNLLKIITEKTLLIDARLENSKDSPVIRVSTKQDPTFLSFEQPKRKSKTVKRIHIKVPSQN